MTTPAIQKNILIVDDEAAVRNLLARTLSEALHYRIDTAGDAAQARRCLLERTYDLVLTDIAMPGDSGLALAEDIAVRYPDTGVVFVSVMTDARTTHAAMALGPYGYILKPFDQRQVVITVENALRRQELEIYYRQKQMELEQQVCDNTHSLKSSAAELDRVRSDLKQTNKELRDQLRFLQTLLDAIPHPVFYKNLYGAYLGCNGALETLLGIPEEQILGKQARDVMPEPLASSAHASDAELLVTQSRVTFETEVVLAAGTVRHLLVTKALYTDDEGCPAGIVGVLLDITENLVMEQELRQTQKMASIGQLAAGVAHEINNPTGYVSSNLKTLDSYQADLARLVTAYRDLKTLCQTAGGALDAPGLSDRIAALDQLEDQIELDYILDDIKELIGESREGMHRIRRIVEDLKSFAHPGQDKVQDTDINQCIETTLSVVNNELKYKAQVTRDLGALPMVSANPQQLNQVFANILVNAAQAIEERGEIHIRTRHADGRVTITIRDTGCGIAQANLERIFEPFFTTKEIGKGTGLGMNITYNIIKKHHGDIQVQSRVGQGTLFTIELPVDGGELENAEPATDGRPGLLEAGA